MEAGDMKAMREALTKVSEWMAHRIATGGFEASPTIPTVLEDVVLPALAKPPRNCDVGTAEEQSKRFSAFCNDHNSHNYGCKNCPCRNSRLSCVLLWAQMPYEREAEK